MPATAFCLRIVFPSIKGVVCLCVRAPAVVSGYGLSPNPNGSEQDRSAILLFPSSLKALAANCRGKGGKVGGGALEMVPR